FGAGFVAAGRRLLQSADEERATVAALLGALVAFMVGAGIDWMWELTVVTVVAFACLALLVGPATATAREDSGARAPRLRIAPRAAVLGICAVAVCLEAVLLFSHMRLDESQSAASR